MSIKPLNELQPQEKGKIVRVGGNKSIRRRLMDMGVVKDTVIIMQRVAPLGDPVEIKIKGYDLALRLKEAAEIIIETEGSL
jgi:Fe2+ transport system protein FeoA